MFTVTLMCRDLLLQNMLGFILNSSHMLAGPPLTKKIPLILRKQPFITYTKSMFEICFNYLQS